MKREHKHHFYTKSYLYVSVHGDFFYQTAKLEMAQNDTHQWTEKLLHLYDRILFSN